MTYFDYLLLLLPWVCLGSLFLALLVAALYLGERSPKLLRPFWTLFLRLVDWTLERERQRAISDNH